MIDPKRREEEEQAKLRIRRHIRAKVDEANYEYYPERKLPGFYDNDVHRRVAAYARVSTGSVGQTSSFELQKKYYEEYVASRPNWELVQIYADYGVSGTTLKHRDAFNQMIADCKAGKIDLILTKSVSRFARNVVLCIETVRKLAELDPPVGVFFESEHIFSVDDTTQQALNFLSMMAEEESHIRSRSMEASLRMRLDHNIPLTPKLLGYTHDGDGNLIVNPEEAPTVKLAFYMYLYGCPTQQIADALNALGRRSYLGNIKWTSGGIIGILRNERHCGEVLTRKTYTPDYRNHLSKKNRGQRPQSRYLNHHEAIISRDDFIAVQQRLDNAKYGNRLVFPQLHAVGAGLLQGFVVIHPRWAGFGEQDYQAAAQSVYAQECRSALPVQIEVNAGDFDLLGFEVVRGELLRPARLPVVTFRDRKISFNAVCVRALGEKEHAELLVDPVARRFAVRPADKESRCAVRISRVVHGGIHPRSVAAAAFSDTFFSLFGWDTGHKYRIAGTLYEKDGETACLFDAADAEILVRAALLPNVSQPVLTIGQHIRAVPAAWMENFGESFYLHEKAATDTPEGIGIAAQPVETGKRLHVTGRDELRRYIKQELGPLFWEDTDDR